MATTTPGFPSTISLAKQTGQGVANTPSATNFTANTGYSLRWLQGSRVYPHADFKQEQEGDGSRAESLNYKTGQWATGKTIIYARPLEAAMLFTAMSGTGSDVKTGASSPYTHTISPATTSAANDFYTLLMTTGKGASTVQNQAVDCVCNKIVVTSGSANPPLKLEADWVGGSNSTSTGAFTPSLSTDGPMYWFGATWVIPTALAGAGNANWQAAVQDLSLTFESELTPTDYIAEAVTPLPLTVGNLKLTGDLTLLWQDGGIAAATYFNGGTTDSPTIATADLSVTFVCSTNAAYTLKIDLPAASWTMADVEPSLDGKPVQQKASLAGLRGSGGFPYQIVALNSANVSY